MSPLPCTHAHTHTRTLTNTVVVLVTLFGDMVHSSVLCIFGDKRATCLIGENQNQVAVAAQMALPRPRSPRGFVGAAEWTAAISLRLTGRGLPQQVLRARFGAAGQTGSHLSPTRQDQRHLNKSTGRQSLQVFWFILLKQIQFFFQNLPGLFNIEFYLTSQRAR